MNAAVEAEESALVQVVCNHCGGTGQDKRYRLDQSWIVSCKDCGFSYVNPRVSPEKLKLNLQTWAKEDVVDAERLRIAFDENTLRLYHKFIGWVDAEIKTSSPNQQRRLLDIGCSTGALLTVARERGWQVEGLEIGSASTQYARQELGLRVHQGSLFDFNLDAGQYDAITITEVIEHLEDPKGALECIATWLKPGGVLFITTPNYDALYRRLYGAKWWVVNCEEEHIMLFNAKSLTAMLASTGYSVVKEHIRGIDIVGMLKQRKSADDNEHSAISVEDNGYYEARSSKEKLKNVFAKMGLLVLVRAGLRLLDSLFSAKSSPIYAWGEQLIVVAVNPVVNERAE